MARQTNEWEFQGQALSWINQVIHDRPLGFEAATQEFPNRQGKRSDIVLWRSRAAKDAILEAELKGPETNLSDPVYQQDAIVKARRASAPYVALWNMRELRVYRTPAAPRVTFLPEDAIATIGTVPSIRAAEDWLTEGNQERLKVLARDLVVALRDLVTQGTVLGQVVDATVFVEALTDRVRGIRELIDGDFKRGLSADRKLNRRINHWAIQQGLTGYVDDIYRSLASQLAYRIAGQALFYHSFRRLRSDLPALTISAGSSVPTQLRAFWDAVRAIDYEALFEPSPLEEVHLTEPTNAAIAALINDLARYAWDRIHIDVLGSVFEQMIPAPERTLLGQYYTRPALVDLIVSLASSGPSDTVLDPAVGTGTFLYRLHDRLTRTSSLSHEQILGRLWGVDISAFAAELAVINLCRLDLASQNNFPRVVVRDFFDLAPGMPIPFPPPRLLPGAPNRIDLPVPVFDAVVGNPPYIRSQHLDDLDARYKAKLQRLLGLNKVGEPPHFAPKFDAFAYFLVHATTFLKPGGRLAFVTSAAWLTARYGAHLQRYLLEHYQPIAVLWSAVEPFFPTVEVDTVVIALERLRPTVRRPTGPIRFATFTAPLSEALPAASSRDYWARVDQLLSVIETSAGGQSDSLRITLVDAGSELDALREHPKTVRNWARYLRMTPIYQELFGS